MGYAVLIVLIISITAYEIFKLYFENREPKCQHEWDEGYVVDYTNRGHVVKRTVTYTCHKCKEIKTNEIG